MARLTQPLRQVGRDGPKVPTIGLGLVGMGSSPEYARKRFEGSLKRLGVGSVDLYYLHRASPDVLVERLLKRCESL